MSKLIAGLCCLMLAASPLALAQDQGKAGEKQAAKKEPSEKQLAHQQRMKDCSAKAGDRKLKGDERKTFMSACLKGEDVPTAKQEAQQNRMKQCNQQAGEKKLEGDERKTFMSACLKG